MADDEREVAGVGPFEDGFVCAIREAWFWRVGKLLYDALHSHRAEQGMAGGGPLHDAPAQWRMIEDAHAELARVLDQFIIAHGEQARVVAEQKEGRCGDPECEDCYPTAKGRH